MLKISSKFGSSTIINGTPHTINIIPKEYVVFDEKIRKHVISEDHPVVFSDIVIESDMVLSARIETEEVTLRDIPIPIYNKKVIGYDPVPTDVDIIIVSALYASAAQNDPFRHNLYTISDPVYSEDGRTIIGCLGLCKFYI